MEEWTKAASVIVGTLMMFSLGSAYAISSWNGQMKDALEMTQSEIAAVAACFTFGQYNSIWAGFFYDRFGVRWTSLVSAVMLATFYWLAAFLSATPSAPHWAMSACFVFIGLGHAFPAVAGMAANEGVYGQIHRGKIMGLLVSSYSGGGAVFAYIYHTWFDHDVDAYFTFIGSSLSLLCIFGAVFLQARGHHHVLERDDEAMPLERKDEVGRDITLWPLVQTAQFWHLFVVVLVGVGCPLFVMNNLSFLVESNGGDVTHVPTLVLLFSLFNLVGRFAMGAISDAWLSTVPRSYFLTASVVLVGVVQLSFVVCPVEYMMVPVVLTGFGEGCVFGLFPVLTRELFGRRHFGKNYGLVSLANAVGFPLVLDPLSSALYRVQLTPGTEKCLGSGCFTPMFFVTAGLSLVATFSSTRLH
ncbi:hypothetical protein H310_03269 [Aphanomyces invadans]|uniref:Major facilitator superfamily (MFS) profile domain-containing protein n=1 Tax=Aphanomyces invadans TaxID=157072 RepID=A0A024UI21_9STRA|nr:hypothetical protein H310_03269 [Aphanomyces invadans]ETW05512.1 hypothetical protein H310_03269 [Aphanomyces invadans]|eukprot:XP_008865289.1 hypothetical protein H310_03269 [Aphanomyces invadans]